MILFKKAFEKITNYIFTTFCLMGDGNTISRAAGNRALSV